MSVVYKIETHSKECARQISDYILERDGCCLVHGWAIITDYSFTSQKSLDLMPLISSITDEMSEYDIHRFEFVKKIAA
ncbi:hypothetical protein L3Q72_21050 [Vibrio sp. JC009]|uniref:hypothetical protein n=1 Tax=Vibrio sp. JC009 TaxID=2912314 RepID=UPI0023AFCB6C|nr:hypothetical protein [Vibrio sp. JC009]WED23727.1 hypothetical protein L3Q72_21050 [Vibrio sp. JC009]